MFDFEKIDDFEKHINMSIPNYDGLVSVFKSFVESYANPQGSVVDLGCSAGTLLHSVDKREDINYLGVDIVDIRKYKDFEFLKCDALEYLKSIKSADVIVSMFTLQFLGKHIRAGMVKEIKRLVSGGAIFLIAEKCFFDSKIENVLKREHLQKKRLHFSDSDILDKDRDLCGSMFCLSNNELMQELKDIGLCTPVWQSYNFIGFVINNSEAFKEANQ